jgi:predicted RND superfamily exporter protein
VHSLATAWDVPAGSESLETVPLLDQFRREPDALRAHVAGSPVYGELFLGAGEKHFIAYVVPKGDVDPVSIVGPALDRAMERASGQLYIHGDPGFNFLVAGQSKRDVIRLGALAVAAVFVICAAIYRRLVAALIIGVAAAMPGLWIIGLVSLAGIPVDAVIAVASIMTVLISTAYTVHVLRQAELGVGTAGAIRRQVAPIVAGAAVTTGVGILALLLTPAESVRLLAVLTIIGMAFAVLVSVGIVPVWAERFADRLRRHGSGQAGDGPGWCAAARGWLLPVSAGAVVLALLAVIGLPGATSEYRVDRLFRGALGAETQRAEELLGGANELRIVVSSDAEWGLVDENRYEALRAFHGRLEELPNVSRVYSIVPLVGWMNARLSGEAGVRQPESVEELGESLELLSGRRSSLPVETLLSPGWQHTRLFLWYRSPPGPTAAAQEEAAELERSVRAAATKLLPELEVGVFGTALRLQEGVRYQLRYLGLTAAVFAAAVFLMALVVSRRLSNALMVLFPPLTALACYFALVSAFSIPMAASSIYVAALLLGVSTDDAVYFVITYRTVQTKRGADPLAATLSNAGTAIVRTSVLIAVGALVLLFSSYRTIGTASVLFAASIGASTVVTLFGLPGIARLLTRSRREQVS